MKQSEEKLDLELIQLLCMLSIINELNRESIAYEFKKLSVDNVLN